MLFRVREAAIIPQRAIAINGSVEHPDLWYNNIIKGFFQYRNPLRDYLFLCANEDISPDVCEFFNVTVKSLVKSKRFRFDFLLMLLSLYTNEQIMFFQESEYDIIINIIKVINRLKDQRFCFSLGSPLTCSLEKDTQNHEAYKLLINGSSIVIERSSLIELKDKLFEASVYLLSPGRNLFIRLSS